MATLKPPGQLTPRLTTFLISGGLTLTLTLTLIEGPLARGEFESKEREPHCMGPLSRANGRERCRSSAPHRYLVADPID